MCGGLRCVNLGGLTRGGLSLGGLTRGGRAEACPPDAVGQRALVLDAVFQLDLAAFADDDRLFFPLCRETNTTGRDFCLRRVDTCEARLDDSVLHQQRTVLRRSERGIRNVREPAGGDRGTALGVEADRRALDAHELALRHRQLRFLRRQNGIFLDVLYPATRDVHFAAFVDAQGDPIDALNLRVEKLQTPVLENGQTFPRIRETATLHDGLAASQDRKRVPAAGPKFAVAYAQQSALSHINELRRATVKLTALRRDTTTRTDPQRRMLAT